jgi:flagellar P-ring protein precursor FlgI
MRLLVNFAFCFWFSGLASLAHADRIKDLASLAGVRNNQLVGYGLVVGLSGTGDANLGITLQSMQAMLSRFGMSTDTFRFVWCQCSSGDGNGRFGTVYQTWTNA